MVHGHPGASSSSRIRVGSSSRSGPCVRSGIARVRAMAVLIPEFRSGTRAWRYRPLSPRRSDRVADRRCSGTAAPSWHHSGAAQPAPRGERDPQRFSGDDGSTDTPSSDSSTARRASRSATRCASDGPTFAGWPTRPGSASCTSGTTSPSRCAQAILALTRRPPDVRRERIDGRLAPNLVASLFGFFVVFGFAGATFLDVFAVPGYDVELWHFAAAVLLGRRCRWVLPEDAFSGATSGRSRPSLVFGG